MLPSLAVNTATFLLQARPAGPRPVTGGNGDAGVALIYLALVVIVFFLIAGLIGFILVGLLNLAEAPEWSQAPAVLVAIAGAVAIMWNYWKLISENLVIAAEWSWIAILLIFIALFLATVLWAAFAGVRSAFSRENVGSTLSFIAIASGTFYLYRFEGWGFWSSLGLSILGMIVLGSAIFLAWDLLSAPRHRQRD